MLEEICVEGSTRLAIVKTDLIRVLDIRRNRFTWVLYIIDCYLSEAFYRTFVNFSRCVVYIDKF